MSNSDSTKNLEHQLGAPVGLAFSSFLETPNKLLINVKSGVDERVRDNCDSLNK